MTKCVFVLVASIVFPVTAQAAPVSSWADFKKPIGTKSESVGRYNLGCLIGGVALASKGKGFESIRRYRNRYYGHQKLITFLTDYGSRISRASLNPVLIGDLSQPRGGRMSSGHRSHQMGLDADVWFSHPQPNRRNKDKSFPSMVRLDTETIDDKHWGPDKSTLLRLAAQDERVARIFVHWVIKRELCRTVSRDASWLAKIRPWWGHSRHFHIRLACDPGDHACVDQPTVGPSGGCGEESWFSKASVARRAKQKRPKKTKKGGVTKSPRLHPRCRAMTQQKSKPKKTRP